MDDSPADKPINPASRWVTDLNGDGAVTIADYGAWIRDTYFAPGDWLLGLLQQHAPGLTDQLALASATAGSPAAALLSGFAWLAVLLVLVLALRSLWRIVIRVRNMLSALRIAVTARVNAFMRALRRILAWRPFSSGKTGNAQADIAISDADIAVLRTQSRLQPGYVLTAPEISNVIRLRPSQVEAILEKLAGLQLVEFAFGSLDGYDGYRITQAGRMYLQICEPKRAAS